MDALKATVAREIDKESVTEAVNVAIHDAEGTLVAQSQEEGMRAGDFYFRTNTVTRYEKASWFRRVILRQREKLILSHPITAVISCPFCGLPLMTPFNNAILCRNPLTLEKPVQCPYSSGSHGFSIKDGNIMPA